MEENTQNNFQNGVNGNMQSNLQNDVNNVEYNINTNMQNNFGDNPNYNPGYNAGYNPNNIQPPKQKKTGLIVLWIILGILALFVIGVVIDIVVKNAAHNNEINDYKNRAAQYLSEKYNEEFEVEFVSEQDKANRCTMDATTTTCGTDKNVREYNFKAKSKATGVEADVTVYKTKDTDEVSVVESKGSRDTSRSIDYQKERKLNTELKPKIEAEVAKYYKSYKVEIGDEDYGTITITINENFVDQTDKVKTCIENVATILKSNITNTAYIKFNDYTYKPSKHNYTITTDEINNIKLAIQSIKQNLKQNYRISGGKYDGITITINGNVKTEYNKNSRVYENLYKELAKYMDVAKESVEFVFNDKTIDIEYYSFSRDSFSSFIGK